ncbi:muscle M-line assembly protein unc-89-like [Sander lucioperca]|uniref:muscle M-line assembly protein unc-89-like n=1 Tax=Sander lucioperca TaxID=283035 RepID=UPI001653B432|nr:muscle M-line assembly protein unc-89-like [Sander lucioperca]
MAPFLFLLFLLSEAASDLIVLTVCPGDDVILPCQAADSSIRALEWTRPDLEPEYVLFYSDGYLETEEQHPDFKDRVDLVDRELKDRDMSLILKNVSSIDNGTYECRVASGGSRRKKRSIIDSEPIRIIRLQVTEPADLIVVTVDPGDDVILPCEAADSSISVVEWTRPDLEPKLVLLNIDGHLDPTYQNPFFKDRVELVDRELKDGDVSLILKNVNNNDTGTYKCRVITGGSRRKKRDIIDSEPIRTIRLQVTEPDLIVVTVDPGDDVILPCEAADSSISVVEWTRPDLEPKLVLLNIDGHLDPTYQNPFFKDRVELVDRDLKDGDVSLILKNVNNNDTGTYKCRVITGGSRRTKRDIDSEPIRIIRLQVTEPDLIVVTVHPGQDALLPCQTADSSISVVEWTRPDLEPKLVLLNIDGHLDPTYQHPSFKDRVELVDRELKDGDVSLILKNVSRQDNGTYECRVKPNDSRHEKRDTDSEPIRTIRLQVTEPDVIVVPVRPGEDVILPCQAADSSIRAVEWTRPDLEPEYVLYYSDGHMDQTYQHPSFKDRVELVDRELKDGNVSLILKNVSRQDNGTYDCQVAPDGSRWKKRGIKSERITIIRLQVTEPADLIVVTVHPGDDVILPCQADDSSIRAVEWIRADLKEPDIILLYSDGFFHTDDQHPSFKDRVELVDRDLKDRDVSLILKNVNRHDAGTYRCRVITDDTNPIRLIRTIRTVRLQVTDPAGSEDRNSSPVGRYIGLAAGGLVVVAAALVGVLMYKRHKDRRSGQPAADADDKVGGVLMYKRRKDMRSGQPADDEASAVEFIIISQSS